MKHQITKHENCDDSNCPICVGGLVHCSLCGGAEGYLPTDCPGLRMTDEQANDVLNLRKDYVDGQGWIDLVVTDFAFLRFDGEFAFYLIYFQNTRSAVIKIAESRFLNFLTKEFIHNQEVNAK